MIDGHFEESRNKEEKHLENILTIQYISQNSFSLTKSEPQIDSLTLVISNKFHVQLNTVFKLTRKFAFTERSINRKKYSSFDTLLIFLIIKILNISNSVKRVKLCMATELVPFSKMHFPGKIKSLTVLIKLVYRTLPQVDRLRADLHGTIFSYATSLRQAYDITWDH